MQLKFYKITFSRLQFLQLTIGTKIELGFYPLQKETKRERFKIIPSLPRFCLSQTLFYCYALHSHSNSYRHVSPKQFHKQSTNINLQLQNQKEQKFGWSNWPFDQTFVSARRMYKRNSRTNAKNSAASIHIQWLTWGIVHIFGNKNQRIHCRWLRLTAKPTQRLRTGRHNHLNNQTHTSTYDIILTFSPNFHLCVAY